MRTSIFLLLPLLLLASITILLLLSSTDKAVVLAQTNTTTTTTSVAPTTTTAVNGTAITTTTKPTTTTTAGPTPAPPALPRFTVPTRAPRATSTTSTTIKTTTTLPPTTTLASSITQTYTQVDVFFKTFFDQYQQNYLTLFRDLSGVPLTRLQVMEYMGFPSAVTGEGFLMSIQVLAATSASTAPPEQTSTILEQALLSGQDPRIAQYGITTAKRVGPQLRQTEGNGTGVNFMWLVLWGLTMLLIILSLAALFRPRSAEVVQEEGSASSGGMSVPADDSHLRTDNLSALVEKAEQKRLEREAKRKEEIKFAPTADLFAATLEYENRVKLPPVGGLRRRDRNKSAGGGGVGGGGADGKDGANNDDLQQQLSQDDHSINNGNNVNIRDAATAENRSNVSDADAAPKHLPENSVVHKNDALSSPNVVVVDIPTNNDNVKISSASASQLSEQQQQQPQKHKNDDFDDEDDDEEKPMISTSKQSSPLAPMGAEANSIATRANDKKKNDDDVDDFL